MQNKNTGNISDYLNTTIKEFHYSFRVGTVSPQILCPQAPPYKKIVY